MTTRPLNEREIPTVELTGRNGNAFTIIGAVKAAMRDAGWTPEEMREVTEDMMSDDYDNLLYVVCEVCEVV